MFSKTVYCPPLPISLPNRGLSTPICSNWDLGSVAVPIYLYGLGEFLSPLGIPAFSKGEVFV